MDKPDKKTGQYFHGNIKKTTILLVEDNADIVYGLKNNLEFEGYNVVAAGNGRDGLKLMHESKPNLVILDLMLPGMNGYDFLSEIRSQGFHTPVLILSAKGEELDKVRGFRMGADDYVTKPFGTMELIARVEAIRRRFTSKDQTSNYWTFGNVEIDTGQRIIKKNKKKIHLTPLEFDLLIALLKRNGEVTSRKELLEEVWQYPEEVVTRTVDTHIAELRNKLEDQPAQPAFILTVPKVGYKLEA